ncbi:hypothetical protein SIO70_14930 [Chitinophaga sancti]|nr:hypothetical protein [Chitinophaga sancti]WPQ66154.1 hypothetical protein SIO70_14930 [Chitinophaga sancti]
MKPVLIAFILCIALSLNAQVFFEDVEFVTAGKIVTSISGELFKILYS